MLNIKSIKVDNEEKPIGTGNTKPRFSWQYEAGSLIVQKSYRILVASDIQLLAENIADLWNSGEIISDKMLNIEYQGKALKSRQICFVKVIAKMTNGEIAESISKFEMALLEENDWKGRWVSIPVNFNGGTLYFRKVLEIDKDKIIKRARAYICGIGYHELYFNGKKVSDSVLNPGVTEYSKRVLYCVYDITQFLHKNDNVIGIEVGYGWYGTRKLLVQLYIDYEDGGVYEDHSAPCCGWWVSGSPRIDNSIYGGEIYDATLETKYPKNWATKDYNPTWENGWMYTIATDKPLGKLEVQSIEPIKVCNEYNEISRIKKSENIYISDIGQNIAGWVKIKVRGDSNSKITLKFSEELTKDGYANQLNLRSARCSDTYILSGNGIEEYSPAFTYHGFRYIQIETEGKVELLELIGQHVHTAVRPTGNFECSDKVLNQLHKNAVITEANNLHSIMTDCPQRDERFGWINDLGSRLFQTVYNFDMSRFFPKFIRDITHTQNEENAICDTAPYYTGGQPADPVCVAYLLFATESYKFYGNTRPSEDEYQGLKGWTEFLLKHSNDYIMDYSYYGDWVSPTCFKDGGADNIYISTTYLYWHLLEMVKIASIANNSIDFNKYQKMAENAKKAINNKYFDKETCNYLKGKQSENAIALSLNLVENEYKQRVAKNLFDNVVAHNHHSTCGNIGYRHLFYALSDNGYTDEVIKILTNPEYPGWGYMIANEATTVWERWEAEMQNEMHSFDHPMFGSYDAWLYAYLGGIKINMDSCGCDKVTVKPYIPANIDYVNCSFETVRGTIISNWKKVNGKILYHIEIPANTSAVICLNNKEITVQSGIYDYEF
jgi:alpha-L-rhamnosidase